MLRAVPESPAITTHRLCSLSPTSPGPTQEHTDHPQRDDTQLTHRLGPDTRTERRTLLPYKCSTIITVIATWNLRRCTQRLCRTHSPNGCFVPSVIYSLNVHSTLRTLTKDFQLLLSRCTTKPKFVRCSLSRS